MSGRLCSPRISEEDDIFDLLRTCRMQLGETHDLHRLVFANLQAALWRVRGTVGEEIADFFVVDLEEGDVDIDCEVVFDVFDPLKEFGHGKIDDARIFRSPADSVSLAASCGLDEGIGV